MAEADNNAESWKLAWNMPPTRTRSARGLRLARWRQRRSRRTSLRSVSQSLLGGPVRWLRGDVQQRHARLLDRRGAGVVAVQVGGGAQLRQARRCLNDRGAT